ncbi:MAG: hypothetical protein ACYC9Q_03705 [Bacillota bacterium]
MRKELPLLVTVLTGLFVIFGHDFAIGEKWQLINAMDKWQTISQAFALLIGAVNLTRIHVNHIRRRKAGYIFSLLLLVALWGYTALGVVEGYKGQNFRWLYNALLVQLDSTIFSLLAFYIATAAYRAFRIRTVEATLLLVSAAIVMLGRAPIGEAIWKGFPDWANWIMRFPNTAAMRAVLIGAYLGSFVTVLRILLGIERAHLGGVGGAGMK